MTDSNKSVLLDGGIEHILEVLSFNPPRFQGPNGRGLKIPGEIRFITPDSDLNINGIGYKLLHNGEWFRFEGSSKTYDLKTNSVVSGFIY